MEDRRATADALLKVWELSGHNFDDFRLVMMSAVDAESGPLCELIYSDPYRAMFLLSQKVEEAV